MREICVDAILVVAWYSPDEDREKPVALLDDCFRFGIRTIAPDCIYAEVGSAIRRKVYRNLLEPDEGWMALSLVDAAPLDCVPTRELYTDAWRIAQDNNLATLYDALYMALAELRGCDFWTADQRFVNSVHDIPYVRHIADFSPGKL